MLKQLFAVAAVCLCLGQFASAQGDLQISGKAEIMIDFMAGEGMSNTADDVDIDLMLSKDLSETIAIKMKLDLEDTATDGDLIEEAYMIFKEVGGAPVDLAVGRKEIAAGQDKMLWETYPLAHKDESDNKWAVEAGIQAGEIARIWVTAFQDVTGMWDSDGDGTPDQAVDNLQSYALKAQFKVDELKINVSLLNAHDQSQTGAGLARDEVEMVFGLDYSIKDLGLNLFFEYLGVTNWNHADGDDGTVTQVGCKYAFGPENQVEVGAIFETRKSSMAGTDTRDDTWMITGVGWKVNPKTTLFSEITAMVDSVADTDFTITTFGVITTF